MKHLVLIYIAAICFIVPVVTTVNSILDSPVAEQHFNISESELERLSNIFVVSATVYNPEVSQCDSTYHITADGSLIDTLNPSRHRWIAVSRDLLENWGGQLRFGDKVKIEGTGTKLDGIHTVRDVMNARFSKKIDFLVSKDFRPGSWKNLTMTKLTEQGS